MNNKLFKLTTSEESFAAHNAHEAAGTVLPAADRLRAQLSRELANRLDSLQKTLKRLSDRATTTNLSISEYHVNASLSSSGEFASLAIEADRQMAEVCLLKESIKALDAAVKWESDDREGVVTKSMGELLQHAKDAARGLPYRTQLLVEGEWMLATNFTRPIQENGKVSRNTVQCTIMAQDGSATENIYTADNYERVSIKPVKEEKA